jgi:hypothetical protein
LTNAANRKHYESKSRNDGKIFQTHTGIVFPFADFGWSILVRDHLFFYLFPGLNRPKINNTMVHNIPELALKKATILLQLFDYPDSRKLLLQLGIIEFKISAAKKLQIQSVKNEIQD